MIWINGLILVITAVLELAGYSLAIWLYSCEWGIGVTDRVFVAYYVLFYCVPAMNLIALLTNKERPVQPKHMVKLHPDNPL
jgi:hypothetical protein